MSKAKATQAKRNVKQNKEWKSYEEVAQFLLNEWTKKFGLGRVEGKQEVRGDSGTKWEIDAKGVLLGEDGFLVVECRRYTTSRLCQEKIAALAYRIRDIGAQGGITVSPYELQAGACLVAQHENIIHVCLSPESTTTDYILQFLKQIFVGRSSRVTATVSLSAQILRNDGTVETKRLSG
jgi:hypothetical protein